MKIIDLSVKNGTGVVVGMIMVVLFGVLALRRIPIQLNPTIDRPIITVETSYPGAAPLEVESEVTIRLEQKLAAVEDLRRMRSTSSEGRSSITLEFEWGTDRDIAIIDIVKRLETVRNLPDDVDPPQIRAVNSDEREAIIRMNLASQTMSQNERRELMEDRIAPQFERVPGVGAVRLYGGSHREIQVLLDLASLESRHVTIDEVLQAISRENQNVRGGKIEEGDSRMLVRTVGQYASLDEIRRTVIKNTDEGIIRVSDIAEVVDAFAESDAIVRIDGRESISIAISKKSGANTLKVTDLVTREVHKINEDIAPLGVELLLNQDSSEYIWDSIKNVSKNLMIGSLFAIIVLFLFFRSAAPTFAVALTIPVCLIGTFVLLAAFGRSVNVISLAGLAFAAGMVVDNAVVVMENIFRHRNELGLDRYASARNATSEVWAPILASTLTTLAVFIPVLFVQEEAGQLFRDIAYSISFAVGLSMIAAITIVPMIASRLMGPVKKRGEDSQDANGASAKPARDPFVMLANAVRRPLLALTQRGIHNRGIRVVIIAAIFGIFFLSLGIVPPAEYLPQSKSMMNFGRMSSPSGTSLEGTDRQLAKMEEWVLADPKLHKTFFVARSNMGFFGMIYNRREVSSEYVEERLKGAQEHAAAVLPSDFRMSIFRRSDFGWGSGGKNVTIDISGRDLAVLQRVSDEIEGQMRAMPEVLSVFSSFELANPELQVTPDRERLADLGMTTRDLATVVETLLEGTRASIYRDGGKEIDLIVKARKGQILHPAALSACMISTPSGRDVRLGEIARVEKGLGPVRVQHLEQERVISLNVMIGEDVALQSFIASTREDIIEPAQAKLPPAYSIAMSGTADDLSRTLVALGSSFILALIIIYLLMAALFESFVYPLIIMLSVPLAMTGAFVGVAVTGSEFNVITMLGLVLLAGIVVNNAILLIDFSLRSLREGLPIPDAILRAVNVRLRPIFMTTLTTVLGMLPLASGLGVGAELYSGLGAAVVGGLIFSTIFTLILVPLMLASVLEAQAWFWGRLGRSDPFAQIPDPEPEGSGS